MLDNRLIAPAFNKAIELLGEHSARLLIQDLEYSGIYLNDPQLKLEQISKALFDHFGDQAASLIFDIFMKELANLASMSNSNA